MATQITSKTALFGRAYELVVIFPDGTQTIVSSSAWEPEALRITFEVSLTGIGSSDAYWFAKVEIYNAEPVLSNKLLQNNLGSNSGGATIKLSAGYQNGSRYGVIYEGTVYQALFERVGVTDDKITLMCYTGLHQTIGNLANLRGNAGMTQYALIQQMCSAANTPMTIGAIDTHVVGQLSQTQLPRRRAFFGDPNKFINDVTAANKLVSWYGFDGLGISLLGPPEGTPDITYDGNTGQIIGTPQQTANGITMQVLLDPNLRVVSPLQKMLLKNTQIRQLAFIPPGFQALLSPDGTYGVNGVAHNGDTWGDTWTTEIVGLNNTVGMIADMMANADLPSGSTQQTLDPRAAN
jgi:hypothetical protein